MTSLLEVIGIMLICLLVIIIYLAATAAVVAIVLYVALTILSWFGVLKAFGIGLIVLVI